MARNIKALMDPNYNLANNVNELAEQVHLMAKSADQKMRRLVKQAEKEGIKEIDKYAYRRAIYDIQHFANAKEGAMRFDTKVDLSSKGAYMQLVKRANAIRSFYNAPTSTITGIKRIYVKRADKINEKYGTNFTWETLANFFENGGTEMLKGNYDSSTVLMAVGKFQKAQKDVIEKIKTWNEIAKQTKLDKEEVTIYKALKDEGIDLSQFAQ